MDIDGDSDSEYSDTYATDEDSEYEPEVPKPTEADSESSEESTAIVTTPQSSRKRVRREKSWACNQRKTKRALGLAYKNTRGVQVSKKTFEIPVCQCGNKCHEKISEAQSEAIFKKFYDLADFNLQTAYIFGQIKVIKKTRVYTENPESRRQFTRIYYLPNENGLDVKVCKDFFKKNLQVSDGRLSRILKSKPEGIPPKDKRGKHPSANKTPEAKVLEVMDFIKRFPVFECHYSRPKSGNRKYLAPDLNITIMYSLYKDQAESAVSRYIFRNIFNTRFNLHFHAPITDSCRKCDEFNNKLKVTEGEEKRNLEIEKELHLRKAELARSEIKKDGEKAMIEENETAAIAFDLMKTLPTPVLSTGITYYKRQLWTYCLGIHNLAKNTAIMYVWNESIASRGPQEIGSCLLHYCKNFVKEKKLIMYSDQCGGQNRNIKMALICDFIATSTEFTVNEIDHKFLVSGHSYLPCDQDFGIVEKEKKFHKDIFLPVHWVTVIKSARKKKPFQVIEISGKDFFSTRVLENSITNRKVSENGSKVEWMKMQWLRYTSENKHRFQFKYSNSEDVLFNSVNVSKRKAGNQVNAVQLLFPNGRPIEKKKKQDLMDLLPYIPPIYHPFYEGLKTSSTAAHELADEHAEGENFDTNDDENAEA
ncbi:unnamed protein product [Ceutorhynchus assimilis]|uniref:Uncharacterized protein n=1 Tax=Ceutorhynchus assimilis TaxID=467358 RepID=A0A9N9MYM2_9CUCU|nr:unnamed protein product [Ceutorhynchus assimilis]